MTVTSPPRAPGGAPGKRPGRPVPRGVRALPLLGPGVLFLIVFMAIPVGLLFVYSFFTRGRFGGVEFTFTTANFEKLLEPVYMSVILQSVAMAVVVTLLALVIGYPIAYALTKISPRWRTIALIAIILPFWTNFLIRTYAWILLLNNAGIVNQSLMGLGIIDSPLPLLYNANTVAVGLLYMYLPLMVLPLYASLQAVDPSLREAATNLGSSPWRVFRTVTLPMSLPGALTGAIFVFVPTMSNFVIPELLGGGKMILIGNLIRDQFLEARNWPFGATLALILTAFLVLLIVGQSWVTRRLNGGGPRD